MMECDVVLLLVVSNFPFIIAAFLALQKRFVALCIILCLVFVSSCAYHASEHERWHEVDCAFAFLGMFFVGVLQTLHAPLWASLLAIMLEVVGVSLFCDHRSYDNVEHCIWHSWWHLSMGVAASIVVLSIPEGG